MSVLVREKHYIRKWRPKAVRGDAAAMSNVAAAYRILEEFGLAARWYERAAAQGDGDALTDWGYCLQHGVGTGKDERAAERAYRAAIDSKSITDYCREEAMYHLAVILFGRRSTSSRRAAAALLRIASADGDYSQAEELLQIVNSAEVPKVCSCRRHLRPRLAQRHCPLHGPLRGQPDGATNGSQPIRSKRNRTSSAGTR
jgi:TPR repeat protein